MTTLPVLPGPAVDCWTHIGVWGDRTCDQLAEVVHCHNCPVFARAGRRFLDAPSPEGYLQEWTRRLAAPPEQQPGDLLGAVIFRLAEEWLALPVASLVEVTTPRRIHRVPGRGGLLAGLVNIRGELHLCVHLDQVLGIARSQEAGGGSQEAGGPASSLTPDARLLIPARRRLLVVQRDGERWVFPVDEVDQVQRFSVGELTAPPATVSRALARLTSGLFHWRQRAIGLIDDARLFHALRGKFQ